MVKRVFGKVDGIEVNYDHSKENREKMEVI